MGISVAPDIFQEQMHNLMEGLDYIQCYLDDLLTLSDRSYKDYLNKIEQVMKHLQSVGLKVRAKNAILQ